jgi:hypothetical protein
MAHLQGGARTRLRRSRGHSPRQRADRDYRAISRLRQFASFLCFPCLEGLAAVASGEEQAEQAARLFGAAEALRESMGTPLPPVYRACHERHVAAARRACGAAAFAAAWAVGRALSLDEAVAEAFRQVAPS